jgi:hypothetical protein
MEKYRIVEREARALEAFLLPMLIYEPENRASARDCLSHYWLKMPAVYEYHMTKDEHEGLIELQNQRLEAL